MKNHANHKIETACCSPTKVATATHADLISTAAVGVLIPICDDALAAEWRLK